MSLRIFHVIFVIVCIALCAFVGAWGIRENRLAVGIVFIVAGIALVIYGVKVFGKLKEVD